MIDEQGIGGEGEGHRQQPERRDGPVRELLACESRVPITGIVGPVQSGWLPMVSTNGVIRNTERAVRDAPVR